MPSGFLLYGANGYVGEAAARQAVQAGLRPILAGRDAAKIERLAAELGVERRVFGLAEPGAIDRGLRNIGVVLHCAGPYIHTSEPMAAACLRAGAHYLDLTGEISVYEALAARDADARARGIMLLPGAGFDVVPTDCLALHLKQRLPAATRLTLAFQAQGPAGLPPGTQRTVIDFAILYGTRVRRNGRLEMVERAPKTRQVDFGQGPVETTCLSWGDIFTAYYSTGIPNIEDYAVLLPAARQQIALLEGLRPLLKLAVIRNLLKRAVAAGPTADQRARTVTHVWGQVEDDQGQRAAARLHGPEAGLVWTVQTALAAVGKALAGNAPAGFQTPALAYGADFVLETEGVTREDLN